MGAGLKVVAIGALVVLIVNGKHPHGHGGASLLSEAAVPLAGSYTQSSWADAFLRSAGEPDTACNHAFVVAWEGAEGGNWGNPARYNPLDTTMREPGSWSMNSVGVQAFPSWREGLQANVATLRNGYYGGTISALNAGNSAQAAADAVAASPWGTPSFTASC